MTPPAGTGRRLPEKSPPAHQTPTCSFGLCASLGLVFDALSATRRSKDVDDALRSLSDRVDDISRRISAADLAAGVPRDSAEEARQAAERDGLEVARYSQIPQFDASILDTYIPRCTRLTQLHFGHIVSNPHAPMAFGEKMGYNMTYNLVPPGHGNALHMHRSIEVFAALDGRWEIAWGMRGEHSVVLQPWDFVAVPARVCHSYRNIEEQTAQNIMTVLPGRSWIAWAPNVVDEARKNGAECDDNGVLTKYAHLVASTEGLAASSESVQWKDMGPDDMAPHLHRFGDRRALAVRMDDGAAGGGPNLEMFWKTVEPEGSIRLPCDPGVDLLLVILDGSVLIKNVLGQPVAAAGRLDAVRVPDQALRKGEVVVANPCPTRCTLLVTATKMRSHNELYFHLC